MTEVYVMDYETLSPIGLFAEDHLEGLRTGRSGAAPITQFDASGFPMRFACEVKGDLSDVAEAVHPDLRATFPYDRKAELFCCCVERLKERAAAGIARISSERLGVFVGAGMEALSVRILEENAVWMTELSLQAFHRENTVPGQVNRLLNPSNLYASVAASAFNATGPQNTNVSACAASSMAIGEAFRAISSGACDAAVVGGVDTTVTPFVLAAFLQLHMISMRNDSPETASRPFDRTRDGFVPGEGAGIMVLANERAAELLGEPRARIEGFGTSLDGYKVTAPHPEGLGAQLAMGRALREAGWEPSSVDYVNAHGTSTPLNDPAEAAALHQVFGDALKDIFVSSTKSQIGHLIAAGGIVELIGTVMGMRHRFMPASINVTRQDPACDLKLSTVPNAPNPIRRAISNSFALAGQNACIALSAVK